MLNAEDRATSANRVNSHECRNILADCGGGGKSECEQRWRWKVRSRVWAFDKALTRFHHGSNKVVLCIKGGVGVQGRGRGHWRGVLFVGRVCLFQRGWSVNGNNTTKGQKTADGHRADGVSARWVEGSI